MRCDTQFVTSASRVKRLRFPGVVAGMAGDVKLLLVLPLMVPVLPVNMAGQPMAVVKCAVADAVGDAWKGHGERHLQASGPIGSVSSAVLRVSSPLSTQDALRWAKLSRAPALVGATHACDCARSGEHTRLRSYLLLSAQAWFAGLAVAAGIGARCITSQGVDLFTSRRLRRHLCRLPRSSELGSSWSSHSIGAFLRACMRYTGDAVLRFWYTPRLRLRAARRATRLRSYTLGRVSSGHAVAAGEAVHQGASQGVFDALATAPAAPVASSLSPDVQIAAPSPLARSDGGRVAASA